MSAAGARAGAQGVRALDASNVSLQGLNVIEANAGTGKTWTITALYVRLLLEARAAVDSILVVTFTEAATGELRDRLRKRLSDTHTAFERGAADANDGFTAALLERVAPHAEALLRLTSALRDFDQAPIYTIHGYCQRVLGDRAFESGMPFRTQIIPDPSALLREIVEDFWRTQTHAASPLYTRFLIDQGIGPRTLAKDVERYLGKPYLEIRQPADPGALATLEQHYAQACSSARCIWLEERAAISAKLVGSTSLSGTSYRQSSIPGWLDEMHACLAPEAPRLELCEKFDRFTPEALAKGTRKGMSPPAHPFFDACRALRDAHTALVHAYQRSLVLLKVALLEYCDTELARRKSQRQLQSYDDLLLNLHKALYDDEKGSQLAEHLRTRYPVALIDEFQDTDPVQYGIFRRIYAGTDQSVFLVGDPKQSIYSFRGADVYAYLAARRDAQSLHTLAVNWRSEPTLLRAVNHLFENVEAPFVIGDIPFVPSRAAPGERGRLVIDAEAPGTPLTVWLIESADGKPVNKTVATEAAARATAAEIARLLNLGARNAARIVEPGFERPLKGGDIAVLARSHRQAMAVNAALAARGIASVQRGAHSVFCTPEGGELERVLAAVAEPGREALIGAALATEMMGMTGEALYVLQGDETRWEKTVESFREAHRTWHEHGFMHMLRAFLQRYGVIPRLLEYADGERRATNLLHLAELLHCEAGRQGMDAVLALLAAKRAQPSDAIEAELLRLESDENLVKLLTVHAAKGLEFPLVFCPYAWDGGLRSVKADVLAFHDPEQNYAPVVDFGSDAIDAAREQAICEERAESLRHLYVALTRAKYRLWMAWGNVNDAASAAPAWLLHRAPRDESAQARAFGTAELPRLDRIRADLERVASGAGGAIGIAALPVAAETVSAEGLSVEKLSGARRFEGVIRDTRYVTSFTALAHGRNRSARLRRRRPRASAGERERPRHLRFSPRRAGGQVRARDIRARRFRTRDARGARARRPARARRARLRRGVAARAHRDGRGGRRDPARRERHAALRYFARASLRRARVLLPDRCVERQDVAQTARRCRFARRDPRARRVAHVHAHARVYARVHRPRLRARRPLLPRGLQIELARCDAGRLRRRRPRNGDGTRSVLPAIPRVLRRAASLSRLAAAGLSVRIALRRCAVSLRARDAAGIGRDRRLRRQACSVRDCGARRIPA